MNRSAAVVLALAALGLAACGGGGTSKSGDEATLRHIIDLTSKSTDPSRCSKYATQRFLERIELQKGSKALDECRNSAKNDRPANSVEIASVNVSGTTATATYTQNGGDSDGQRFTVDFVKSGGDWRFDHISALKIDRPKFDRSMRDSLVRPPDALSPTVADCSVRELGKTSDAAIERAVVETKPAVLIRPIAVCAIAAELRKLKLTDTQVTCAARRSVDALSDAELEATIANTSDQSAVENALKKALVACGAGNSAGSTSTS